MQKKYLQNGRENMGYSIKFTEEFLEEIDEICEYISLNLKASRAANILRKKVINNVLLIEKLPKIFSKIDKFDKAKRQYRKFIVNNYIILYTIDEDKKIIYISICIMEEKII